MPLAHPLDRERMRGAQHGIMWWNIVRAAQSVSGEANLAR
jgi:hypothetical protein